jgi:hypothetical protein
MEELKCIICVSPLAKWVSMEFDVENEATIELSHYISNAIYSNDLCRSSALRRLKIREYKCVVEQYNAKMRSLSKERKRMKQLRDELNEKIISLEWLE